MENVTSTLHTVLFVDQVFIELVFSQYPIYGVLTKYLFFVSLLEGCDIMYMHMVYGCRMGMGSGYIPLLMTWWGDLSGLVLRLIQRIPKQIFVPISTFWVSISIGVSPVV